MTEATKRGRAKTMYADDDTVLLREKCSGMYMISSSDYQKGRKLIGEIPRDANIIANDS